MNPKHDHPHKRDQRSRGARPTTRRGAIHSNTTKLILNTFEKQTRAPGGGTNDAGGRDERRRGAGRTAQGRATDMSNTVHTLLNALTHCLTT